MRKVFFNAINKFAFLSLLLAIFSIHLPTMFMDVALILLFVSWAFSGDYTSKFNRVTSNIGAVSAILLFVIFGLSIFYAVVPFHESVSGWFKYHGLLFIPIVVSMLQKKSERDLAVLSYILGALFVTLLCYAKWLGVIPVDFVRQDASPGNYIVFRHSISQSIFIAFAVYLMMTKARLSRGVTQKCWVVAYALSLGSIIFLVDSRSAQIAMGSMILFFLYRHWQPSYMKYILGLLFLSAALNSQFSPHFRFMDVQNEIREAQIEKKVTSSGQRLELWQNTWSLISRHPFLGGGVGSFVYEYKTFVPPDKIVTVQDYKNVHNQYLLTLDEAGLLGLGFFLLFFFYQWEAATRLTYPPLKEAFMWLIITFVVTSFFNCMFWGGEAKCYYLMAGVFLSGLAPLKKQVWALTFPYKPLK